MRIENYSLWVNLEYKSELYSFYNVKISIAKKHTPIFIIDEFLVCQTLIFQRIFAD